MITKKHFILSFFFISILVLALARTANATTSTDRIAGYDRYQTAVAARQSGDGAKPKQQQPEVGQALRP